MPWTPLVTRATGVFITPDIWNTDLVANLNYIINSSGNLAISGSGPHAIGSAVLAYAGFLYSPTFTPVGAVANSGFAVSPVINAVVNQDTYVLDVAGTIVEAGSGAHNLFTGMRIRPPAITAGAATLANAVTMLIHGVPAAGTFTAALFIDALGDDGVHIALADSVDVAHGIINNAPTSVYGVLRKGSATDGGLSVSGYSEGATGLKGTSVGTTSDTTTGGGSNGNLMFVGEVKSGAGTTTLGATANLMVLKNGVNATHIFKADGSSWQDATGQTAWNVYDDFDDIALIENLEYEITATKGNPIKRQFTAWMVEQRDVLQRLNLASFNDDGTIFVSSSGIQSLLCGFARQCASRIVGLEARVSALESQHA